VLTAVAAVGLVAGGGASAQASAVVSPTTVAVTIRNSGIVLAPALVPTGPVVFRIRNRTASTADFGIAGRRTRAIPVGRSAILAVTLARRGAQTVSSKATGRSMRATGILDVFEPCTSPATTTVSVEMAQDQGGIAVSQTAVPCGTVTFVVTDAGAVNDSLQVFSEAPSVTGSTPDLRPGQTARLTLHFTAKGPVHYQSGDYPPAEPEFAGDYNEEGQLTLV
jgi:hypothetical protein